MPRLSSFSQFFKLIILLEVVFIAAAVIWYAPIVFKGYSTVDLWSSALVARNLAQFGVFGAEDSHNIFLASSLVKEQARPYLMGNKFTPIAIAQVFKLTGVPQYENLIFVSIAILAVTLLIFTFTVYYLFDLKTAALFAFIYILLPFNWWQAPYNFGNYEIGLFSASLFFLFFFLGLKSKFKYKYFLIIISGIFLALAGIAKEVMLVIAPVLFIYLLFTPHQNFAQKQVLSGTGKFGAGFKKQKKYLLCLFIPFFIIIFLFWLPDMLSGKNAYILFLGDRSPPTQSDFLNWDHLAHIYPDPYTYYFDREAYLNRFKSDIFFSDLGLIDKFQISKALIDVGLESPNLIERFKIGSLLLARHSARFLAFEEIGGPFIFLLLILGFAYLRRENKYLYRFFVFWIIFVLFFLSYVLIVSRSHLLDFGWVIALIVALGLLFLIDISAQYFQISGKRKIIIGLPLTLLVLYNLILSGHVLWGRKYDEPHHAEILAYAQEINKSKIADQDVIAINLGQFKISKLNYLTNKSMVVFTPETLEKLIKEDKLQIAFDEFKVKYILGYSDELTKETLENSRVVNIASDSLSIEIPKTSKTKSWFMNLVR